ncbi:MAG: hypothetical protein H6Q66_196 [Firmicutes bacterium]|nr:hypothetical protein [Bacillota bacterium]
MLIPTRSILFPTLFICNPTFLFFQAFLIVYFFTIRTVFFCHYEKTVRISSCFAFDKHKINPAYSVFFENTIILNSNIDGPPATREPSISSVHQKVIFLSFCSHSRRISSRVRLIFANCSGCQSYIPVPVLAPRFPFATGSFNIGDTPWLSHKSLFK